MGAPRTCLFFIIFQLIYVVSAQETIKRVPQGFVGMRGKKFTASDSTEMDHFFKRKPQFFVGVKGKKSLFDNLEQDVFDYKRAPMGFVGMRGKKDYLPDDVNDFAPTYKDYPTSTGSLVGQIDYSTNEVFKYPETTIVNALLNDYLRKLENPDGVESETKSVPRPEEISEELILNELEKRAANMHQFYGVRGKKSVQDKRPYDLNFRGKFIGVRGKKDAKNNDVLKYLLTQNAPWPKRKTQMGFFGMRGKKWTEDDACDHAGKDYPTTAGSLVAQIDYLINEEFYNPETTIVNPLLHDYIRQLENPNAVETETRPAPRPEEITDEQILNEIDKLAEDLHQLYGVRGKKSVQDKRPYDLNFRGKFIGVRGKKDAKNNAVLKFLLTQNAPYWPKRRRKTQMEFFG